MTDNRLIKEFIEKQGLTDEKLQELRLSSPLEWKSGAMLHRSKEWIDVLYEHREEPVLIVPDYDTDGVMSGVLLYAALYELGFQDVHVYYPTMETGYGLSTDSFNEAISEMPHAKVLITTDNGIKAYAGVEAAKNAGLTVLVTDHHPGVEKEPIADVIVDPNSAYDSEYPFKDICGAEVVYKLMVYYAETYGSDVNIRRVRALYPFAGIAAVADMMAVLDENRFLIKETVKFLSNFTVDYEASLEYLRPFKGLWAILNVLSKNGKLKYGLDADTIGFYISPMLNASRRVMVSSKHAFQIFLEDDVQVAERYADELWSINEYRKARSAALSRESIVRFSGMDSLVTIIDAGVGYAGLVSGRLTQTFDLPTVVFSYPVTGEGLLVVDEQLQSGTTLHGSGRAPEWFHLGNMMAILSEQHPEWFVSWGGHAGALGCVLRAEYILEFKMAFAHHVGRRLEELKESHVEVVSKVIDVDDKDAVLVPEYVEFLKGLEPFGIGLPRLSVRYEIELGELIEMKMMGSDDQHLKLKTDGFDVLIWNYQDMYNLSKLTNGVRGQRISLLGSLSVNEWRGRVTPQFVVASIE